MQVHVLYNVPCPDPAQISRVSEHIYYMYIAVLVQQVLRIFSHNCDGAIDIQGVSCAVRVQQEPKVCEQTVALLVQQVLRVCEHSCTYSTGLKGSEHSYAGPTGIGGL